jgi:glutamine---fructose-6-phosphate transaminase (isomerizing)
MCGIFGQFTENRIDVPLIKSLSNYARRRGVDSSGLAYFSDSYKVLREHHDIKTTLQNNKWKKSPIVIGHSRLVTNGLNDNQPVVRDQLVLIHNGIIVNEDEIWSKVQVSRQFEIDSEAILAVTIDHLKGSGSLDTLTEKIFSTCRGAISAVLLLPEHGKALLFSNNGSLYYGKKNGSTVFSSERYPLEKNKINNIHQIYQTGILIDIPVSSEVSVVSVDQQRNNDLIPVFQDDASEKAMLEYHTHSLTRCSKCILPESMPFIEFDENGVCNYCNNYHSRNTPKGMEAIQSLIEPYRGDGPYDCIVPFSGGRDSCYSLHIIVKELGLRPLTFTYDWGMVTDLARRNISRMCDQLGIENIVIAANIEKKRRNIKKNLKAWLRHPDLGMVSILTAGDKHFFKYNEVVKRENNLLLELWGTNPLEITHFKSGFLGVSPQFLSKNVYSSGLKNQWDYQKRRLKAMIKSPGYFNTSLFDTLSGEYYRSIRKREHYFHVYNYFQWEENEVNRVLESYGFEKAPDTSTTWRIGDGTAAFYNYIYYTVAGFTEHDTFRSNQIREGQLTRKEALTLIQEENKPRYQNIRWYLDAVGMDFKKVIPTINRISKLY